MGLSRPTEVGQLKVHVSIYESRNLISRSGASLMTGRLCCLSVKMIVIKVFVLVIHINNTAEHDNSEHASVL